MKDKLTALSDAVSALATDIANGASADQIRQGASTIGSDAAAVATACVTQ